MWDYIFFVKNIKNLLFFDKNLYICRNGTLNVEEIVRWVKFRKLHNSSNINNLILRNLV